MLRVLSIFGTRPEAIKMAPVVKELGKHPGQIESVVCVTAQHRQMLDQVLKLFAIRPDIDLDLMEENQNLASLTARGITALTEVLQRVRPDLVLVQGDTTTAMVASLAAFYQQIPVGHVEAGLRTRNRYSPFPEEINRRLIGALATYHFAPTQVAADALRGEGVAAKCVFITGNTVIDALLWTICQPASLETIRILIRHGIPIPTDNFSFYAEQVGDPNTSVGDRHRLILVTAHRRENFGRPLENICRALQGIVQRNPDVKIIYPVHMNPNVREPAYRILNGHPRIHLTEPLEYEAFAHLMSQAYLILTDSGGIQEEAPSMGKPVLVVRTETERAEAVTAGTAKVIGVDPAAIVEETERLLYDHAEYGRMAQAINPYGDGHAAERIVKVILSQTGELPGGDDIGTNEKSNVVIQNVSKSPGIQLRVAVDRQPREPIAKRLFDLALAALGLALALPLWILISVAIYLEDGSPILFIQKRVGKGGKEFTAYKFRTIFTRYDDEVRQGVAVHSNDHKVMLVGRFLRQTALNELPQLLNILRGDMSFVGPRPEPLEFIAAYEREVPNLGRIRYQIRPGLTGIAQVFGRHNTSPRNKLRYDLFYMRRRSFWLDIKLIGISVWNTVRAKWDA